MNESALVKECLKGKPDSQKHLYEHYAPKMLGVCYRFANSREEAEDFLQEAFITIFRKLEQWKGDGELGAWIRKVVVNTSLNGIKARHRFSDNINVIPIDQVQDSIAFYDHTDSKELMEVIHRLPVGYRTVFNLYAIEGFSHDEIAKMLNIKASTSRSQYMKARKMLMQKISPELKMNGNDE